MEPPIPEDLLPSQSAELKMLLETKAEDIADNSIQALYEGIMAGETIEQLIPKFGKYISNYFLFYFFLCYHDLFML